jgi:hypothetical protein
MNSDEKIKNWFQNLGAAALGVSKDQSNEWFFEWVTSAMSLIRSVYGENSPYYRNFENEYNKLLEHPIRYKLCVQACLGIFNSARKDYESGYLFTVRSLVKAEDSVDVLEQANNLLNGNYKDPACILAGVALEIAMKEMCNRNSIPIAKLETMNIELGKKTIYNMGMQKQITAWAHLRNKAAHGELSEYDNAQVKSMIEGVQKFVADYL